jgi:hypothetical protein
MGGAAKHVHEYLKANGPSTIAAMVDELHKKGAVEKTVERLKAAKILRHVNAHEKGFPGIYAIESEVKND